MKTRQNPAHVISHANGFAQVRGPSEVVEPGNGDSPTADLSAEKHYSVGELARLWNLSEKTIRRMFENEPGVLQWGSQETRYKRGYTTLRIPESVMLRVHRRFRIAG